jgi:hypothetical protein
MAYTKHSMFLPILYALGCLSKNTEGAALRRRDTAQHLWECFKEQFLIKRKERESKSGIISHPTH